MIKSIKALGVLCLKDSGLGLEFHKPVPGERRGTWFLTPVGARVHGNTAKAAIKRGLMIAQDDLFPGEGD